MKLRPTWPFRPPPPAPPDPLLGQILALLHTIMTQGQMIMLTQADVTAALATETTREGTIISLLTTAAANQKDLQAQLAAALAESDPVAQQAVLQASLDTVNANVANMDAAIASVQPPAPAAA